MPDMVETYAGEWTPWWEGTSQTAKSMRVLAGPADIDTMMSEASLIWDVTKQPAFVTGEHAGRIPGWNAVQRATDGAIYGLVKDSYSLFQNAEGAEFMKVLMVEAGGEIEAASAGSLYGGALVWVLARVDKEIFVKGDGSPYADFILGMWGHDGRHSFILCDTLTRVVCWNTASTAVAGSKHKISIRHTKNMAERVEDARRALDIKAKYTERLVTVLTDLTKRPMTADAVRDFTIALLPSNPDVDHAYKTEAERSSILALYENSATLVGVKPTAYRAYQAVTEYLDHVKDIRDTKKVSGIDRRAVGMIEGPAYDVKARALALLAKA
jgi:phage/plasmid-like protein (TIGR03299 family)